MGDAIVGGTMLPLSYWLTLRAQLEKGCTVTENCFGYTTVYSLAKPGPFMPGVSAAFIANHLEQRHKAWNSTLEVSFQ